MVAGRVTEKTKIFELSVVLREVRPLVRRRVQVPGEITLGRLHDVLQLALGWTDGHLHEFRLGEDRYGCSDPEWGDDEVADETKVKLFRLVEHGGRLIYAYDFGDGWTHDITVEKVLAAQPGVAYPRCVSGRRACPPEDVGGPWGYDEFLTAINDPGMLSMSSFWSGSAAGLTPRSSTSTRSTRRWRPWPGRRCRIRRLERGRRILADHGLAGGGLAGGGLCRLMIENWSSAVAGGRSARARLISPRTVVWVRS